MIAVRYPSVAVLAVVSRRTCSWCGWWIEISHWFLFLKSILNCAGYLIRSIGSAPGIHQPRSQLPNTYDPVVSYVLLQFHSPCTPTFQVAIAFCGLMRGFAPPLSSLFGSRQTAGRSIFGWVKRLIPTELAACGGFGTLSGFRITTNSVGINRYTKICAGSKSHASIIYPPLFTSQIQISLIPDNIRNNKAVIM